MKKHAVLIGINNYKRLGTLHYSRQDAEAMADALKRCYGFSDDEITLMTDESNNPPEDRFAIQEALSPDFYTNDLELFVFGFFGHGIRENDQRYLCPMNVRDIFLTDTGLPLKVVQELLGRIRAKNICLILDCCQNEVSTESRSAAQTMTEDEEKSLALMACDIMGMLKENTEDPEFAPKVAVLNSCKKGERAFVSVEHRHGLFTAVLLDAMEKRCKSTVELINYSRDNMPKALRVPGVHQIPYYTCAGGSDIVLPAVHKKYDVFLSYRRDGGAFLAKLIQTQLESRNLSVFLDVNESMAGGHFDETLVTRIEDSTCFVPILRPGCFARPDAMSDSDWFYKEILHAVRSHKAIVLAFASGFSWDRENLPERVEWLRNVDGVEYQPVSVNAFLDRLAKAVRQPGNLNHDAILEQMTAPYRAPVRKAVTPSVLGNPSETMEELSEKSYQQFRTEEEESARVENVSRLAQEQVEAEKNVRDVVPGNVTLPFFFNPNPEQYEKFWEKKFISGKTAVSRDGKYLAITCSNDIIILNFYTGTVLQTLTGHTLSVESLCFSPDGRFLASGNREIVTRIWNVQTGKLVKAIKGLASSVDSLRYSPDGRFLTLGGFNATVQIWSVQTSECVKTFQGYIGDVTSVSYSPDGQFIVSGNDDNTVRIWNIQTEECVKTLKGDTSWVRSLSYSPDGQFIVTGSWDKTIRIWSVQTGECVKTIQGHTDDVTSVNYSPDGQFIVSGSRDYTARIWSVQTGECVKTLKGHTSSILSVSYSPDGRFIVSGSSGYRKDADNTVRIWNVQTGECVKTIQGHAGDIASISYSPDGQFIATSGGYKENSVRIWNIQTSECVKTLKGHTGDVTSVSYFPDGQFIATGGGYKDNTIRIWNTQTGECVKTLEGHGSVVTSVSHSPDGRFIASGSWDNTVRIWNTQSEECVKTLEGHNNSVFSVSYSPDGRFIASGSGDKTVRIWNAQTGECRKMLEGHMSEVRSVGFSPDGRFLASGSNDSTIRIWNAQTGECVNTLKEDSPVGHVDSLNYSPDGRFIASGGGFFKGYFVYVWNVQTGECVKKLIGNMGHIWSVVYSPDGKYLSVGSEFGLTVWRVE